jgi:uncharacterized membrane protein
MANQTLSTTLAASLAAAIAAYAATASAAPPAGKEPCYGIALKGHNDCAAGFHSCAGKSVANYSPADFKFVPYGTCESTTVKGHKGSLTAS